MQSLALAAVLAVVGFASTHAQRLHLLEDWLVHLSNGLLQTVRSVVGEVVAKALHLTTWTRWNNVRNSNIHTTHSTHTHLRDCVVDGLLQMHNLHLRDTSIGCVEKKPRKKKVL